MKTVRLRDLARIIRSKNAGPFEMCLDVLFDDAETYEAVRDSGALCADALVRLYKVAPEELLSIHWFKPALAFKATLIRRVSSGTVGDTDVFGAQQHAPLLDLPVKWR